MSAFAGRKARLRTLADIDANQRITVRERKGIVERQAFTKLTGSSHRQLWDVHFQIRSDSAFVPLSMVKFAPVMEEASGLWRTQGEN